MAEYLRREGYVDLERLLELRARIWVLRVRLEHVTSITFGNAPDFGLEPGDLVADDYGACQEFAERCRTDDDLPRTIRVPSAALPGTENLVIFGSRVLSPYHVDPVEEIDIPAGIVADGAHPLHTLINRTRYVGDPHPQLEAWREGVDWLFDEPGRELVTSHYQ